MPAPLIQDIHAFLSQRGMPITTENLNRAMNMLATNPQLRPSYAEMGGGGGDQFDQAMETAAILGGDDIPYGIPAPAAGPVVREALSPPNMGGPSAPPVPGMKPEFMGGGPRVGHLATNPGNPTSSQLPPATPGMKPGGGPGVPGFQMGGGLPPSPSAGVPSVIPHNFPGTAQAAPQEIPTTVIQPGDPNAQGYDSGMPTWLQAIIGAALPALTAVLASRFGSRGNAGGGIPMGGPAPQLTAPPKQLPPPQRLLPAPGQGTGQATSSLNDTAYPDILKGMSGGSSIVPGRPDITKPRTRVQAGSSRQQSLNPNKPTTKPAGNSEGIDAKGGDGSKEKLRKAVAKKKTAKSAK